MEVEVLRVGRDDSRRVISGGNLLITIVCSSIVINGYIIHSVNNKKPILIKFGKRIREERNKLGWSQEILAARAGVHRTYIGMIERAEKNITLENIERLAKALKTTPNELL